MDQDEKNRKFIDNQATIIEALKVLVELSMDDRRFTQARSLAETLEFVAALKGPIGSHKLEADEMRFADSNAKIDAIKAFRNRTGCTLHEAKDEVEKYMTLVRR